MRKSEEGNRATVWIELRIKRRGHRSEQVRRRGEACAALLCADEVKTLGGECARDIDFCRRAENILRDYWTLDCALAEQSTGVGSVFIDGGGSHPEGDCP